MPPNVESVTDSVRICQTMSRRRAPSALRSPISRVRSLTTISMMFMMTMPPTTSDSADDADEDGEDALGRRAVDAEQRVGREHAEVVGILRPQPALDAQRHRRVVHRRLATSGLFGLTTSCMPHMRDPNIFWKLPIEMIAKLSCELPNADPFFLWTPTTRKCTLPIEIVLSIGSIGPNSLSATSQPMIVTGRSAAISTGLISRPRSTS